MTLYGPGQSIRSVAMQGDSIYAVEGKGAVIRVDVNGGAAATLAGPSTGTARIAAADGGILWTDGRGPGGSTEIVYRSAAGSLTTLASGEVDPKFLTVVAGRLYWVRQEKNNRIESAELP